MTTLETLADEMRPFHNHVCMLYDTMLVRLVGVSQDERDLYYIVRHLNMVGTNKRQVAASAVGHCYSLKGCLPEDRYASTDAILTRRGAMPLGEFAIVDETKGEAYPVCEGDEDDEERVVELPSYPQW
jgi:hypothetical protein